MSSWKEVADINPFNKESVSTDILKPPSIEEASGLSRMMIKSVDGREIPVYVDQSTRSVYRVREK